MFPYAPTDIAKQAIQAQRSFQQGSAHFELHAKAFQKTSNVKGDIDYARGKSLSVQLIDLDFKKRSSLIYHVEGSKVVVYNNYSDEEIVKNSSSASPTSKLATILKSVPDPVSVIADPNWLPKFFQHIAKFKEYKVLHSKSGILLERKKPHTYDFTRISFNANHQLTGVSASVNGQSFSWIVNYSAKRKDLSIPSGAPVVTAFHSHLPMPEFADANAKAVSLQVLRAERKLKPSKILVKRPDRQSTVFWNAGMIRQDGPSSSWAYDGKNLSLAVGKSFYRGKASHADALDYLASLNHGEEALSRSFLLRTNPVEDFFAPNATVKIVGSMTDKGVPSTILQIDGRTTKSSLIIKDSSHLVESATTDLLGTGGKVLQHDEANFQYMPLPSTDPNFFRLPVPAHLQVKKFPKTAIKLGQYTDIKTSYQPSFLRNSKNRASGRH